MTAENQIIGVRTVRSLCIRVARDFSGLVQTAKDLCGSILIIGPPGSGKTTFLRDLIRTKANQDNGSIAVVDEKSEIFPVYNDLFCFETGMRTDVLTGCTKTQGIDIALRNMGPSMIAVDEITAREDCEALASAAWCGVDLLATAHASCKQDLYHRKVYKPIVESGLFHHLIVLRQDKTWYTERMNL